jgi:GT2 family glycosyltransferase
VAVCTRNRPADLRECVATILANQGGPPFEVVVIDQSDSPESKDALGPALQDRRLRYIPTPTRGVSRSRNLAIANARAEKLLFTDDDCRVPPDWMAKAWAVFERDPATDIACGRVRAPPDLPPEAIVATFEPAEEEIFQGRHLSPMRPWGLTANMIVRRRAIEQLGGFDPVLGPGGDLRAAEDTDLLLRAIGAGLRVRESPGFEVLHLGVRTGKEASDLWTVYAISTGAAYAKNLRLGTPGVAALTARWLLATGAVSIKNLFLMGRPRGARYILRMFQGGGRSLRYRLDRRTGCLVPMGSQTPEPTA